jgi:uncharacterized protein (DUF1778 family)
MARKKDGRTELLNVRVSVDEKQMLATLAKIDGVTSSDVVRIIIRRAFAKAKNDGSLK